MPRKNILNIVFIFFTMLIIVACGQVGFITGGDVDNQAPQPIQEEMMPPMASRNIKPDKIVIPFDEFIALNNPSQNIRIIPNDVKLKPEIKKKSLVLTVTSGAWEDTTTYAIYLNRAVKDITENNDSLMIYVFSTGSKIDTLMAQVNVVDAFTNKPVKDVTVGLYRKELIQNDTNKIFPRYLALTDQEGNATFNYLKEGEYYAYAFDDDNKNNRLDALEFQGRTKNTIVPDTIIDLIPQIRLMPPPKDTSFKVVKTDVVNPTKWSIKFSQALSDTQKFFSFIEPLPIAEKWNEDRDSVDYFFQNVKKSGKYALVLNESLDTISKKYFFRTLPEFDYNNNLNKGVLLITDTFALSFNDAINTIDTNKISLLGLKEEDSVYQSIDFKLEITDVDELKFIHSRKFDSIKLKLPKETIQLFNYPQKDSLFFNFAIQQQSKVGNLLVKLDSIPPYSILELINNKNIVIRSAIIDGVDEVTFENLQTGDYKYRLIIDENKDGKWTNGNIFTNTPAEKVIWFSESSNIRANWDVEAKLSIKPEIEPTKEDKMKSILNDGLE